MLALECPVVPNEGLPAVRFLPGFTLELASGSPVLGPLEAAGVLPGLAAG